MIRSLFTPPQLPCRASAALVPLRIVAGAAFMFHGWGKIQHPLTWMGEDSGVPAVLQLLAALSEFGGGLAWILGLLTPLASFGMACTMAVAVWLHAVKFGDPFVSTGEGGAYEPAAGYLCVAILLMFAGPGRFSLDQLLFGRRAEPAPGP